MGEGATREREQVRAVRERAGLVDLSSRGRLLATGKDREKFLQGLVSNDVKALAPGEGCYATLNTPKGHLISELTIHREAEAFILLSPAETGEALRKALEKYAFFSQAKVEDLAPKTAHLGLVGPLAPEVLPRAAQDAPPGGAKTYSIASCRLAGSAVRVVRSRDLALDGYDILVPRDAAAAAWDALLAAGEGAGLAPFGTEAWEILRIEAGRPRYGLDLDDQTIPQEANLDDALSWTKGCYVGQETIARLHYRGHTNRNLRGLDLGDAPPPPHGASILAGEAEVGKVTSACRSPTLGRTIALGYVRRGFGAEGATLAVRAAAGEPALPARVVRTPFAGEPAP